MKNKKPIIETIPGERMPNLKIDIQVNTTKGLKHWGNVLERAKNQDKTLFKTFQGSKHPFTFEEIITKAEKVIKLLNQTKTNAKS